MLPPVMGGDQPPPEEKKSFTYHDVQEGLTKARESLGKYWIICSLLVVGFLLWALLWLWLEARFKFVFIDVLVTGLVEIVAPFKRCRDIARSYWMWQIGFGLATSMSGIVLFQDLWSRLLARYAKTPDLPLMTFLTD